MDARRFDNLTRRAARSSFGAGAPTRRGLLKGLAGAAALGLLARRGRPTGATFASSVGPDLPYMVVRPSDLGGRGEDARIDDLPAPGTAVSLKHRAAS